MRRGAIDKPASDSDAVSKLLSFFGVASVEAWHMKYYRMSVAYRHSPSFESDKSALATWLRLGELEAEQQECTDYSEAQFRRALREIRGLTQAPLREALEKIQQLCNESGVFLALVKPFSRTALSGAACGSRPVRPSFNSAHAIRPMTICGSACSTRPLISCCTAKSASLSTGQKRMRSPPTSRRKPINGPRIFSCRRTPGSSLSQRPYTAKAPFANSPKNKA